MSLKKVAQNVAKLMFCQNYYFLIRFAATSCDIVISCGHLSFQNCYEMEKYLRHEPQMKLVKKARLASGNRRSSWSDVFTTAKSNSVDDILAIKEEVDIKREMSDLVNILKILVRPQGVGCISLFTFL
jgi:hypothetical protein